MSAIVAHRVGDGPNKVLVLHGWFGASVFDGFFDDFDQHQFEFVIVHNPGYGVAKSETWPTDITDLARMQLQLASELGWSQFHVIGHSYGGAVALRMATLEPNKVRSLVGIAPVMPSGFDAIGAANIGADESTGPAFMAAYSKGPTAADGPRMIAAGLDALIAKNEEQLQGLIDTLYQTIDEAAFNHYFIVWTSASFVEAVKGLATKSLFQVAINDPFVAVNYVTPTVNSMAPGSVQVEEIEGGHFLTVTGREGSKKSIKHFLNS